MTRIKINTNVEMDIEEVWSKLTNEQSDEFFYKLVEIYASFDDERERIKKIIKEYEVKKNDD